MEASAYESGPGEPRGLGALYEMPVLRREMTGTDARPGGCTREGQAVQSASVRDAAVLPADEAAMATTRPGPDRAYAGTRWSNRTTVTHSSSSSTWRSSGTLLRASERVGR
eukprot:1420413-Rhodomonas_salina.1